MDAEEHGAYEDDKKALKYHRRRMKYFRTDEEKAAAAVRVSRKQALFEELREQAATAEVSRRASAVVRGSGGILPALIEKWKTPDNWNDTALNKAERRPRSPERRPASPIAGRGQLTPRSSRRQREQTEEEVRRIHKMAAIAEPAVVAEEASTAWKSKGRLQSLRP